MLGNNNVKVTSESLLKFLTNHKTKELVKMCLIVIIKLLMKYKYY